MRDLTFTQKFGALFDGFKTHSAKDQRAATIMTTWFLIRRLLFALLIIYANPLFQWVQLFGNLWLVLADLVIKIHYSPYESKLGGFLEKQNDFYVLWCSYMLFCFTDYVITIDNKQFSAWMFAGSVCLMMGTNIFVLLVFSTKTFIKNFRQRQI